MPSGEPANRRNPHEGRPPILTDAHLESVWKQRDATSWTGPQFSAALEAAYSVSYSLRYCADLLRRARGSNLVTRYAATRRPAAAEERAA
jgi:hypothetical protein